MAVYARGYRPYDGTFRSMPVALSIFGEGARMALARKGVRRLGLLISLIFCVYAGILYFQFGLSEQAERAGGPMGAALKGLFKLNSHFRAFHNISTILGSIAAVLVGAGLIADDLRTRALALYLVRPIRPTEYMLGKSLIIPALLVPLLLLPGLMLWLLVGLWQPPGETWQFLGDNADIAGRVLKFYVIASISLTGLMLLLSSRTPRRGVVMGFAAAVLFGGPFLRAIGMRLDNAIGSGLRSLDLMNNMTREFKLAAPERWEGRVTARHGAGVHPAADAVWFVAIVLLLAGLYLTWRRARTVEVGE